MSARRLLWFGLGVLWIIDGLLQAQPSMFTAQFVTSVLQPVGNGQPAWLGSWLAVGMSLWKQNMALANTGALLMQLLIGVLLLSGWRRPWGGIGLGLSIVWGLGVWVFGEGLGMLAMGGPTVITGVPGSVLIYVAVALLLFLPERWWLSGAVTLWTMRALGVFWLVVALAQAWPGSGYWTAKGLSGIFQSAAGAPQPTVLSGPIAAVATATAAAPLLWNGAFVLAMLVLGVAFLSGIRAWWVWGLSAVWLLFTWWMGQDFGSLFSGTSTDPNTAIPLGLLTIALALPHGRGLAEADARRRTATPAVSRSAAEQGSATPFNALRSSTPSPLAAPDPGTAGGA